MLNKAAREQFAQLVARGESAGQAYVAAYGPAKGADQSAFRLLRNAQIRRRIGELEAEISSKLLEASIRERNTRVKALQNRWDLLNAVIQERAEIYGQMGEERGPGAGTGLLCLDYRGKDAVQAIWKVDTGLLSEMRHIEEQVARELGQWDPEPAAAGAIVPVTVNVTFVASGS